MTRSAVTAAAALLVALFAAFTALFAVFAPGTLTPDERQEEQRLLGQTAEGDLLLHMVLFQRYLEKAAIAGAAENWELAAFYAEKIEDNSQRVVDGGYLIDGVDVSALAAEVALHRAENLVAAAEAAEPEPFRVATGQMIDGCNACHRRSGYRYVQIIAPDESEYPSQDFAPLPPPAGR